MISLFYTKTAPAYPPNQYTKKVYLITLLLYDSLKHFKHIIILFRCLDWSSCHDFSKDSLEFPGLNDSVGKISPGQSSPVLDELSELITQLSSITETDQNKELLSSLRKQARDFAFAKLVHAAGAPDLFLSPEFQVSYNLF